MDTVFWDADDGLLMKDLGKGKITTAKYFTAFLERILRSHLANVLFHTSPVVTALRMVLQSASTCTHIPLISFYGMYRSSLPGEDFLRIN